MSVLLAFVRTLRIALRTRAALQLEILALRFLEEHLVLLPTEVHRGHERRTEGKIGRRRVPLSRLGVEALKLFAKYDLFDHMPDRARIPPETMVPWYQELYYHVVAAARRVKDPRTGRPLHFTPQSFRQSFALTLAHLVAGDTTTGARILGHSPQSFTRLLRTHTPSSAV